jgi:thioredoxin-like negative regulator of GroEL
MKEKTYTHRELTSLINERFVAISVDADQQRDFIKQMGIQSLPTTLIVAPDLQVLKRLEGFQSANQLMQVMSR